MNPTLCAIVIGDVSAIRTLKELDMLEIDAHAIDTAAAYGRHDILRMLVDEFGREHVDTYVYTHVCRDAATGTRGDAVIGWATACITACNGV